MRNSRHSRNFLTEHQYNLTTAPWAEFFPERQPPAPGTVTHYSQIIRAAPPPLAAPAILSFLAFTNRATSFTDNNLVYTSLVTPSNSSSVSSLSWEWESEWARCIASGKSNPTSAPSGSFRPGSIDGVWEGVFVVRTYQYIASSSLKRSSTTTSVHTRLF